jgi:hypothetical protein
MQTLNQISEKNDVSKNKDCLRQGTSGEGKGKRKMRGL